MAVILLIGCLIGSVTIHLSLSAHKLQAGPARGNTLASSPGFDSGDRSSRDQEDSTLIGYGRKLIEHTARFLGPKGSVRSISNGMNCANCHLDGGTRPFAANYYGVASTYPKYRSRSGTVEDIVKRINDCLLRSLNGDSLGRNSREMKAFAAYINWVGRDVPRGELPVGVGLREVPRLTRMADSFNGKEHYLKYCAQCHGRNGEGVMAPDGVEWTYPPLWGKHSYNTAAGLFRISKFAAFIKANMPYGASTYDKPFLTDDQAWDIAAYVNSQPRPHKVFSGDWPDLSRKPIDHPFGPYTDSFSEAQHKYGPWTFMEGSRNN